MSEAHKRFQKDKKEPSPVLEKKSLKKSLPPSLRKTKDKAEVIKDKAELPEKKVLQRPSQEVPTRQNHSPASSSLAFSQTKIKAGEQKKKISDKSTNFAETKSKPVIPEEIPEKTSPKITKKDRAIQSLQKFKQHFVSKKDVAKEKDKTKGRIYRSLQDRKAFSLVVLGSVIVLIAGVIGLYFLYQNQSQTRLVEALRFFSIPENPEDFVPKAHPVLIEFINRGDASIALFQKMYSSMTVAQKVGALLVLGELKNPQGLSLCVDALQGNVPLLASFAARSIARFKEKAVGILMEKWKTAVSSNKPYFIEAMALTEQSEVLPVLLESIQKEDIKTRETAAAYLKYFKNRKEIIEPLYSALSDKENTVATKALETWDILHRDQILSNYAESLSSKTKNLFLSSKSPEIRSRLIRFMGILGLCLKKDGDNYISLFRDDVRKAFLEDSLPEKIAAAYVLGRFQDEEMLSELISHIESDTPELSENIALSLASLGSQSVPGEILSRKWKRSAHVQKTLAKILQDYSIYTIRLSLKDKAIAFLMDMMRVSYFSAQENIAAALALYTLQPVDLLIVTNLDVKNFVALLSKIKKGEDRTSSYLNKNFSPKMQEQLALYDTGKEPSEDMKQMLLEEINRVLCDSGFYSQERFPEEKPWPQGKEIHFHRYLLERAYHQELTPVYIISYPDLKNSKNFIKQFVPERKKQDNVPAKPYREDEVDPSDKRDPISRNIWYQLSRETQKLLLDAMEKEELFSDAQNAFLQEINQLMCKSSLYQEALFEKIVLTPECKKLIDKNLSKRDTVYLNRLLLQLVYPKEIAIKGQLVNDSSTNKK